MIGGRRPRYEAEAAGGFNLHLLDLGLRYGEAERALGKQEGAMIFSPFWWYWSWWLVWLPRPRVLRRTGNVLFVEFNKK